MTPRGAARLAMERSAAAGDSAADIAEQAAHAAAEAARALGASCSGVAAAAAVASFAAGAVVVTQTLQWEYAWQRAEAEWRAGRRAWSPSAATRATPTHTAVLDLCEVKVDAPSGGGGSGAGPASQVVIRSMIAPATVDDGGRAPSDQPDAEQAESAVVELLQQQLAAERDVSTALQQDLERLQRALRSAHSHCSDRKDRAESL